MTFSRFFAAALALLPPLGLAQDSTEESQWRSTADLPLEEAVILFGDAPPPQEIGTSTATQQSRSMALASSEEAAAASATTPRRLDDAPSPILAGNVADEITPEIAELARGLQYDPLNIFNFVYNRIEFEAYYGSKKGAHLTLLEMSGNDYDQAALLVALLKASGVPSTYQAGPVGLTYETISQWTGIQNPYSHMTDAQFAALIGKSATDPDLPNLRKQYAVSTFFYTRGYPVAERAILNSQLAFGIPMVWVRFSDNGVTRNVCPAYKSHLWTPGVDIGTPVQMSKTEILAEAGGETSISGSAWVRNINYAKLSALLSTYASRMLADLKANHDSKPLDEIVSSRRIVETQFRNLGEVPQIVTYSTSWSGFETWSGTAIPETRMSKLAVIAGTGTYNTTTDLFATQLYSRTFTMPELSARKLSLSFSGNTATLAQDDVVSGPSTFTVSGSSASINLKVIHPYYWLSYSNGAYTATEAGRGNQNGIATYYKADANHYALVRSFGNPQKLLRKRQETLDKYRRDGLAETDPRLKSEVLNILGLNWYYQTWSNDRIASGYLQILPLFHHRIGRVSQESSYYIDVFNQYYSISNRSSNANLSNCYVQVATATHSAMEHGVIEQTEGVAGVSTARMVYVANLAHDRIFRATTTTWSAAKSQLTGYSASTLAAIEAEMNVANTVGLMTEVGNRGLNQWKGAGYAIVRPDYVSMKIKGGITGGVSNGGYVTEIYRQLEADTLADMIHRGPAYLPASGNVVPVPYQLNLDHWFAQPFLPASRSYPSAKAPSKFTAQIVPQQASWDPVDMLSGAYFLDKSDLDSGRMAFSRHYHSHLRYDDSAGLGYGWAHGHSIRLTELSSLRAAMGEVNAYQAAPQLIATLAANVVHYQNATAKEWAIAMLISHWMVEQMQANAVSITAGNRTIEFVKMPDGTYIAPPGMNVSLVKSTGTTPVYTMTERHGNTYVFNADKRISTITDPSGNVQAFSYNGSGQLISVQDSFNHTYTYSWDNGRISGVSDGTGRGVGFGYTSGNLTSVTDPEGKVWTYQYDAEHRLLSLKDPDDRFIVQNDYDSLGRVIRQRSMGDSNRAWNFAWSGFLNLEEDPTGALTSYHYDGRGRSLGVTDALGNRSGMTYDGQDRIVSQATPNGETTTRVWNADNNPVSETDPKNYTSQFFYDAQKRLERVRDKRGKDTTFTWSTAHQMLSRTDPLGHSVAFEYFPNGNLKSLTDATNKKTTFGYDTWGQVNKVTFPDGKFQSSTSNARGDLLTEVDAMNRTVTYTWNKRGQLLTTTLPSVPGEPVAVYTNLYDNSGNLQSSTDAKGNATSFTWNALGKSLTAMMPTLSAGSNVLTSQYDLCDRLASLTNSSGHSVSYEHDAAKRLTAVTDPLNRRSETTYDANSRPVSSKDPLARISALSWSPRGEQEGHTDPLNHSSAFQFDAEGNLTQFTNRRGKSYGFVYDDAGRPTSSTTPGGKTTLTSYFDNNLVETVTEPSGQLTTLAYDNQWRVQSLTDPVGTITTTYDDSGLPLTVAEGAATTTRTYDERGRLKTFTSADGDLIQYRYDANDNLSRIVYPDGKQVDYTYNARNQLETVTDWNQRVTTYQYDRLGRLTGVLRPNGTTATIGRDAAGQLKEIRESANGGLFSYLRFDYDAAGQIEGRFHAPLIQTGWQHPAFTATYDDDNRLSSVNGQGVTHDPDGNMTQGPLTPSSGNASLTFNARNHLTSAGGVSYTYDAEGRRLTSTDAAGTTRYVIDPNGGLSRMLVKHAPDGGKTFYVYGLGLLYEVGETETTKTYHFDQVGSTVARTNDAGALIGRAEYSAYGLVAWKNGDMDTPFLYNGQYGVTTESNGLLHMRARYYSPYLMRFVNADPIGFGGGSNWFAYADGDPISFSDPSGLASVKVLYNAGGGYVERIIDNPTDGEFLDFIAGFPDKSIKALQINGHGNHSEIYYNDMDVENGGSVWANPIDGKLYAGAGTLLAPVLGPKMQDVSIINFAGCKTAQVLGFSQGDNLTKVASREIPGVPVTGFVGTAFGNELHIPFTNASSGPIGSDHTEVDFGIVKTYQNGERINAWGSGGRYWYDTWKKGSKMK